MSVLIFLSKSNESVPTNIEKNFGQVKRRMIKDIVKKFPARVLVGKRCRDDRIRTSGLFGPERSALPGCVTSRK